MSNDEKDYNTFQDSLPRRLDEPEAILLEHEEEASDEH